MFSVQHKKNGPDPIGTPIKGMRAADRESGRIGLRGGIGQFRRPPAGMAGDQSGAVLPVLAVFLMLLSLVSVGAVEITRRGLAKEELQNALDAASLAGMNRYEKLMTSGQSTGAKESAEADARAMFANVIDASRNFKERPPLELVWGSRTLEARSAANFTLVFDRLIPATVTKLDVASRAEMVIQTPFEVALILDNSGSMDSVDSGSGGKSRMRMLREASIGFVHDMFEFGLRAQNIDDPMKISVVPWASMLNIKGEAPRAPDMTGVRRAVPTSNDGSGTTVANPISRSGIVRFDRSVWRTRTWAGCIEGDVESRTTYNDSSVASWRANASLPWSPNTSCPTPLLGLSANRMQVVETIERMATGGQTHADLGLRWGLRTLSPNNGWPSFFGLTQPPRKWDDRVKKVAILITDGENVQASQNYGYWGCVPNYYINYYDRNPECVGAPDREDLDDAMLGWCRAMRVNYGVHVYTVALNVSDPVGRQKLRDCVGPDTSRAYAVNAVDLAATLRSIAQDAINLRLQM